MKTALIFLVGNRDVQVPKTKLGELKTKYSDHLIPNNEGRKEYSIVNKSVNAPLSFLEVSRMMYDDLDYFYPFAAFPMLEATEKIIAEKGVDVDKYIISTSSQEPPHRQDCLYFAKIIEDHLKREGKQCELRLCEHNPNDFPKMVSFYTELFESVVADYDSLLISNSGGTPTMRSASQFAGIFRGFDYITVNAEDQSNLESFRKQEQIILRNTVQSMLQVFDYEGVLRLPFENKKVNALANYALSRIALNFKLALEEVAPFRDDPEIGPLYEELDKAFSIRELEREMFLSAKIKFHQKSYADYLWRLFTIHENMLVPIVEELLGGKVIYDKKSNFKDWRELVTKDKDLVEKLENKTIGKNPLKWQEPNRHTYLSIVNFYLPKKTAKRPPYIDDLDKCLNALSLLRNTIAHSYGYNEQHELSGIGLKEMESRLAKQSFSVASFNRLFSDYIDLDWEDNGPYDHINQLIVELMD